MHPVQNCLETLDLLRREVAVAVEPGEQRIKAGRLGRIIGVADLAALADEACLAQLAEMLGDGRLRNVEALGERADAQLAGGKPLEHGASGRVGKGAEDF